MAKKNYAILIIAMCLLTGIEGHFLQVSGAFAEGILIKNITIVSPEREEILSNAHVLIKEDRIVSVSSNEFTVSLENYQIINGQGRFLTPGLIDSHVHLTQIPGMRYDQAKKHPEIAEAFRRQLPRSYLYFGYTTLIDLNANLSSIKKIESAELHPDIYHCGRSLPLANGYPMPFLPPEVRFQSQPNFLYDHRHADQIPAEYKPENHSPKATVQRVFDNGGICVKTYWEDGAGIFGWPTATVEMIKEVVHESHQHRLPTLLHANSYKGQAVAVKSGVDVVAHGLWIWHEFDGQAELPSAIKLVLDDIITQKIGYMPTMQVVYGEKAMFAPQFLNDPNLEHVVSKDLIEWYKTEDGQWFRRELENLYEETSAFAEKKFGLNRATITRDPAQVPEQFKRQAQQTVRYLAKNSTNFLFGSDTPSSPAYTNPVGYNGYLEMQRWQENGISLRQIFEAATINNAKAFHLEQQYGTIETGKIANLLLLDKNPLETLEAYDTIEAILIHGQYLKRDQLSALH